jgi:predicted transglutaminase-like cysteine proteinase
MGFSVQSRALRAFILACGFASVGAVSGVRAETLISSATHTIGKAAEPFGLAASTLTSGGLREKWLGVQRRLEDEMVQLALCEGDRDGCASPAALQFLDIVDAGKSRKGRARLGEINRAVNLAIRPVSDLAQYGQIDVWASPLATLARGAGDCEDYAIAKFVALRRAGLDADHLRIVIMHDPVRGEDHAIAAARLDGRWLTLDNRHMAMVEDVQVINYHPIFLIDAEGVKRYRDAIPEGLDQQVASIATRHSAPENSPMQAAVRARAEALSASD